MDIKSWNIKENAIALIVFVALAAIVYLFAGWVGFPIPPFFITIFWICVGVAVVIGLIRAFFTVLVAGTILVSAVSCVSAADILTFTQANCPACEAAKEIIKEAKQQGIKFRTADLAERQDLFDLYGVNTTPTFVAIDSQGRELGRHVGRLNRKGELSKLHRLGMTDAQRMGEVVKTMDRIGKSMDRTTAKLEQREAAKKSALKKEPQPTLEEVKFPVAGEWIDTGVKENGGSAARIAAREAVAKKMPRHPLVDNWVSQGREGNNRLNTLIEDWRTNKAGTLEFRFIYQADGIRLARERGEK